MTVVVTPLSAEEWRERCRKADAELALEENEEENDEDIEEAMRMEALVFESRWYNSR